METKEFMNKIEELKQDIKAQLKQVTNQGRINAKLYDASYIGKDTPYEAIAKLTQLVDIFQQKHSELVVLENELMSQLLELKGE